MKSRLDEIAPYPSTGEVTANTLLRYETVHTYAHEARTRDLATAASSTRPGSPEWSRYSESAMTLVRQFAVVFLLRQIRDIAPDRADEVAAHLQELWTDGGVIRECLYDWLVEAGIDPREVERAVTSRKEAA